MTATAARDPGARTRFWLPLVAGQVRYQLLLLARSPMGTFTAWIIPLMLLVALDVATPDATMYELRGIRYTDFLVPGVVTFALLNACYVNVITSVVLARENGVLKRLHGTPLPLWAYLLGRAVAAACVAVVSIAVLLGVAVIFMHVHLDAGQLATLTGLAALGIVTFTMLGAAVSTLVPAPDSALPVAYGTLLPLAFVSDVFFPSTSAPGWLRHLAEAFPISPLARSAELTFASPHGGWPMTNLQLGVTLGWFAAAAAVLGLAFRWEPGAVLARGLRHQLQRGLRLVGRHR